MEATPAPKKHTCQRPCCQCKPTRVMKNNCMKANQDREDAEALCLPFITAHQQCISVKRAEIEAKKALENQA